MGASGENQLITELEATLEQQQTAVEESNAAIRETIRELQEALRTLDQRQNSLTQSTAGLTGRAVNGLEAVRAAVTESAQAAKEHEAALEKIAELERELLTRESLAERLEVSEGQREQMQRELEQQSQLLVEAEKAHKKLRKIEQVYKDASDALQAGQAARRRVAELETTIEEYKQAAHAERDRSAAIQQALDAVREHEAKLEDELATFKALDLQRMAEELDSARRNGVTLAAELVEARRGAERFERDAHELDEELAARTVDAEMWKRRAEECEDKLAAAAECERLRRQSGEKDEALQALHQAAEQTERELTALRSKADRADDLQALTKRLEEEHAALASRAKQAEKELAAERAKGTKAQLAAQLAEALRERETMHEELCRLKDSAGNGNRATEPATAPAEPDTYSIPALRIPSYDSRRMLGEIFLNAGIISQAQLDEALAAQRKERPWKHLGSILVRMGHTEEMHVARAVAHQRGLEFLALEPGAVNRNAARLVSVRLAEKHLCIPVREEDGELVVAMEYPLDLIAIEDVERTSERRVRPAVATPTAILAAIAAVYTLEPQRA